MPMNAVSHIIFCWLGTLFCLLLRISRSPISPKNKNGRFEITSIVFGMRGKSFRWSAKSWYELGWGIFGKKCAIIGNTIVGANSIAVRIRADLFAFVVISNKNAFNKSPKVQYNSNASNTLQIPINWGSDRFFAKQKLQYYKDSAIRSI